MATTPEIEVPVTATLDSFDMPPLAEAAEPVSYQLRSESDRVEDVTHLLPPGWTAHRQDLSPVIVNEERPRRVRGLIVVDSASDLVTAVKQRTLDGYAPVLYGYEEGLRLIAVLNDPQNSLPAWGDYQVVAQLRRTPEWEAWLDSQGLQSQEEFAEFIEDHLEDIVDPPAADMLELAQTFHAHTTARFQRATRLQSGSVSLTYEEDEQVTAGGDRSITIPREFTIAVRLFAGVERFKVTARLRYRVGRGTLELGWVLNRPADLERAVFDEQLDAAATELDITSIRGRP